MPMESVEIVCFSEVEAFCEVGILLLSSASISIDLELWWVSIEETLTQSLSGNEMGERADSGRRVVEGEESWWYWLSDELPS